MTKREYGTITIDDSRDELLSIEAKEIMSDRYVYRGETYQELFGRVAIYYSDDQAHAQRLYDYISQHWLMPATPILSNGGTDRGLPISCFLNEYQDSLGGIWDTYRENMRLAATGGGIGSYAGKLRAIGESVGEQGETSGMISFLKPMDAQTLAVSQGSLRRGSAAVYVQIEHPEVEEFIQMRKLSGGDQNRKCPNLHHGIVISDAFMNAVAADEMWVYKSPKTNEPVMNKNGEFRQIRARELWARIIDMRMELGEPYMLFIDTVNDAVPLHHRKAGLFVKTSNLCVEIMEPTNEERTAVCCLFSLNLAKYPEWKGNEQFMEDAFRMIDNVLSDFIKKAAKWPEMAKAIFAATSERSVGCGVMGWHTLLQQMGISIESEEARFWNRNIFKWIRQQADRVSEKLAYERGPCPDAERFGVMQRFSYKMAVAPTASISVLAGSVSPSIEPLAGNAYTHKTLSGSALVKNQVLEKLLEEKGQNTDEVWMSIINSEGSVQHLDFLTDDEKLVYLTAYEIDQNWIITHAADRAGYVDQGVSNNLFFPPDVDKATLHEVHWRAWAEGVKSLYYCRSKSLKKAHAVSTRVNRVRIEEQPEAEKYVVCEACQ